MTCSYISYREYNRLCEIGWSIRHQQENADHPYGLTFYRQDGAKARETHRDLGLRND